MVVMMQHLKREHLPMAFFVGYLFSISFDYTQKTHTQIKSVWIWKDFMIINTNLWKEKQFLFCFSNSLFSVSMKVASSVPWML